MAKIQDNTKCLVHENKKLQEFSKKITKLQNMIQKAVATEVSYVFHDIF